MDREARIGARGPWRTAVAAAATLALVITPGLALGAEDGGEHGGGGHSGGGGGMGGGETGPGNNLAMPVVWAEPESLRPELRGLPEQSSLTEPVLGTYTLHPLVITPEETTYVMVSEGEPPVQTPAFLQKEETNEWQAESVELADSDLPVTAKGRMPLTFLDWGDNLEAKDWTTNQMVRVETRLLQDVSGLTDTAPAQGAAPSGMTGYLMKKVGGSKTTEMWGVAAAQAPAVPDSSDPGPWSAIQEQRPEAFTFTDHACLTIERIDRATTVSWDPGAQAWTDDGDPVCVGDVLEGPGGYGAEVTVSGGMTYGYVWHARGASAGLYRLTFSLTPGAGVDIAPSTEVYVSETEEEGGSGHKPPGSGEHEAATAAAEEDGSDMGGKPAGNTAVIMPGLDLSYIDVGLSYDDTLPTPPLDLTASRGVDAITLTWSPPVSSGASPTTEYVVTGARLEDGAPLDEQRIAADAPLTATFTGLSGGEPYTFRVVAVSAQGDGAPASTTATPKAPAAKPPAVAAPAPPVAAPPAPPAATPPTVGKAATVRAKALRKKSRLYVNVNPNKGKRHWSFVVQKKRKGIWRTRSKVYRTEGSKETRTLNLKKGKYRVVVLPKFGYAAAVSDPVRLKR